MPDTSEKKLYSHNIVKTYELFIKSKYNYINFDDVLKHADMTDYAQGNEEWFSQDQINRFYYRLKDLTANEDLAYEAGKYSTSPEAIGTYRTSFLSLANPLKAYKQVTDISHSLTKSASYQTEELSEKSVQITVTQNEGVSEEPYQCRNRIGIFEGIYQIFDNTKEPKIDHADDQCMFKDGKNACVYIISWELPESVRWKRYLKIYGITILCIFILASLMMYPFLPISLAWYLFIGGLLLIGNFGFLIKSLQIEKKDIRTQLDIKSASLLAEIYKHYMNSLIIKEVGQALSEKSDLDDMLNKVARILDDRLEFDRGVIMLADRKQTYLEYRESFGYTKELVDYWNDEKGFNISKEATGPFIVSFLEQRPFTVPDVKQIINNCSPRTQALLNRIKIKAFICYPIVFERSLGIIAVDNYSSARKIQKSDTNLLGGIAHQIAMSIVANENAATKARENLVMRAVHNIRNPAYVLKTNLDYLSEHEKLTRQNEILEIIDESKLAVHRIQDLASNMFRYIQPIEDRQTLVDIKTILDELLKTSKIGSDQVSLIISENAKTVVVDKSGLQWVFEELLENANKNKKSDQDLRITIKSIVSDNRIRISFQDNGKGIHKNFQQKMFEPFVSSDTLSGTGLGLTTIKQIIEENNGSFFLNQKFTNGAMFIIELPIK
jgi:signal transduction histidine kinase